MSSKFFSGRRNRRKGELLKHNKPNLTNEEKRFTLIYVQDSTSEAKNLGVYQSLEEAKDMAQKSVVETGMLHIFTEDSRVLYSEKRGSIDAEQ